MYSVKVVVYVVYIGKQREAAILIQSLLELQPWFLSFRWKTCLRQNYSLSSCACSGLAFGQNTLMIDTECKENMCHPFNSRRGRLKGSKNILQYGV